ncbi:ADP-ribosylglycohydrolase family protein [Vreelandella alkaliphila]|uniref:ADP-ribosylglycohydrolase n=1 Tax=Halomonas campaniensis TaxID=213554 RepID=A0A3D0KGM2_9GAMM|nr:MULTISPECIES: ADP-ribosylglycohydrolase family protein [unclassified Halomonas]HCA02678.1 ADP-ribosylglycohydrolase [Halomonas campaniensis]
MNISPDPSRWTGCLLGLAVGDALGAPLEFHSRDRLKPITGMIEGGKFRMRQGEWTDDTAMALCLADSLIACDGFDAADQMARYWRWAEEGENSTRPRAFGIGKTVAGALARYQQSGSPWCGSESSASSGNGSLMRLAPIPMRYAGSVMLGEYAELSSQTTHASSLCVSASRLMSQLISNALLGATDKTAWLMSVPSEVHAPSLINALAEGEYRVKERVDIFGSGYVVESLEAALWCLWQTESFEDAVLMAANLGDDADTTAAITGQLAGAFYGVASIPDAWLEVLHQKQRIQGTAQQLYKAYCFDASLAVPNK